MLRSYEVLDGFRELRSMVLVATHPPQTGHLMSAGRRPVSDTTHIYSRTLIARLQSMTFDDSVHQEHLAQFADLLEATWSRFPLVVQPGQSETDSTGFASLLKPLAGSEVHEMQNRNAAIALNDRAKSRFRWIMFLVFAFGATALSLSYVLLFRVERKRRATIEALQISEMQSSSAIEHARDVVFRMSLDGRIITLNPVFETITGWRREDWLDRPFIRMLHPGDVRFAFELLRYATNETLPRTYELRVSSKSGKWLVGEFTTTTQFVDGKPECILGIVRDITARKEAEAERDRLIGKLREAVAEVKTLSGLLPICSYCKKIRDDSGKYHQVEEFISSNSGAKFTHGICPSCTDGFLPPSL